MTRRFGLFVALCVACGNEGSGTGESESTSTSSGGEESSTSSTTMVMTTTPPTTTMTATTTPPDTGESTGDPPCTDPFTMGDFDRAELYQLEEGAETIFTDIGTIAGDIYLAGSAAQEAGGIRLATTYVL